MTETAIVLSAMVAAVAISVVAFVVICFRLDRPIAERLAPLGVGLALETLPLLVVAYVVSGLALVSIVLAIHATSLVLFDWARRKLIEADAGETGEVQG